MYYFLFSWIEYLPINQIVGFEDLKFHTKPMIKIRIL